MKKKTYKVVLADKREEFIDAYGYHEDGDQFVFNTGDPTDMAFFMVREVIGIYVMKPDASIPDGDFRAGS